MVVWETDIPLSRIAADLCWVCSLGEQGDRCIDMHWVTAQALLGWCKSKLVLVRSQFRDLGEGGWRVGERVYRGWEGR